MMRRLTFLAPLLSILVLACGGGGSHSGFDTNEGSQTAEDPKSDAGGGTFGAGSDAGAGDDGTCAAVTAKPEAPQVDIIFVIDDSASMNAEMMQVRQNVNDFAAKIGQSGLDYRVIFIVKRATSPSQTGNVICVPPPLGGANCADNPPRFFHVNQDVQSNNSLSLILSTYDSSNPSLAWASHVRAAAFKVFIEVSDDGGYDMASQSFDDQLLAKGGGVFGTAQKRSYAFHAICGWDPSTAPPSTTKCSTADHSGETYQGLALLTGGIIESVCKSDYSSVLDHLAQGIHDQAACELGYPSAAAADPKKVVVQMTPSGGVASKLTEVVDASHCGVVQDGWYYDDPAHPTKIILCPSTCDAANKSSGTVDALVGCTAPAPR